MDHGPVSFAQMCFPIELGGDHAGGHGPNGYLFGSTNRVHFGVGKFDLPGVHVVDQLFAVHNVHADDVVVQLSDHIHWVSEFWSFDPEVHFVNPYRVHCVSRCGNTAVSI